MSIKKKRLPWKREGDYAGYCKGMHLLVAEDNELNYEVVSELLDMYEITCDRADDGSVCVEKFCASKENAYERNPDGYARCR